MSEGQRGHKVTQPINKNHPSPFCTAKGGRAKRSETQGVHTTALQKQKSQPITKNQRNHSSKEPSHHPSPFCTAKGGTRQAQQDAGGSYHGTPKNRNHNPSPKITAIIVQKNHPAHPSPFCGAKGGRVERSETQGVNTTALQKQKSQPIIKNHRNHSSKEPAHHPSPFCTAKGGRVKRSKTQGVNTTTLQTQQSPQSQFITRISVIRGSDK